MAQFEVMVVRSTGEYVVDCQANLLRHLPTRVVAPLFRPDEGIQRGGRLNPAFDVGGAELILAPQFLVSIPTTELRNQGTSLEAHEFEIMGAIDMLITGI